MLTRTRTLDSHVSRLRQKLERVPDDRFVVNVWGVGYKLVDEREPRFPRPQSRP